MRKAINFLLGIFFVCYSYGQKNLNISKQPTWVDYQNYNIEPNIDQDEITQGSLNLLADYQINIDKEASYFRLVTKITDKVGIQSASTITAVYDPLYQKVLFHSIKIIRNGEEINKLFLDHFQVIRRESNAENHLYDGSLSAILNLSDVRNGDIIDVSYTIKGFNPVHNGRFSSSFNLNDYVAIGKINVSLNTSETLNYKLYSTTLKPVISKKNNYTNYNWTVETPEETVYEESIPDWKIVMPTVIVSNYSSWKEVVKWGNTHYDQKQALNKAVKNKVIEINNQNNSEGKRIKATLDFVQNDIRYLGLEYGISGYKPNAPNKVFEQRYGDCKDKSLLMVEMLKEMDIEAYPMLVSTSLKNTITELPASPSFFNHCVVKVVDENQHEFYYDPTLVNQGGTYKNTHFPNYEYGLVIKKDNVPFDTILSSSTNNISTIEKYTIKEINKGASLEVTNTYSDVEADRMRNYFLNNSKKSIRKNHEDFYLDYFSKIKIINDPVVEDNLLENKLKVIQSYSIDSIWQPMNMKEGYIGIEFIPSTLKDILNVSNLENRQNEVSLPYPVSREHIINISLPEKWGIKNDYEEINNDAFYYDFHVKYNKSKNEVEIRNYVKIQEPLIRQDGFKKYTDDIHKLEESFGYSIFIQTDEIKSAGDDSSLDFFEFLIALILFIIIIFAFMKIKFIKKYIGDVEKD